MASAATPAERQDYLRRLLAIAEDAKVKRFALARAGDLELAQDALQQTYDSMARIKDPRGIQDLQAYFHRVLVRVTYALRGQLGAVLPGDFTALADARQSKARGITLPRLVDETVAVHLLAAGWIERFMVERASLLAAVPSRSSDPGRYSELIVSVAEQVLRSLVAADVCDADGNQALRLAYPEWFAELGGKVGNAHQRFSRARADVRGLLRMVVSRDELYPLAWLDAGGAVDALAQQVGVAEVAGVLLDHVQVDQPQRHRLPVVRERGVERRVVRRRVGQPALLGVPRVVRGRPSGVGGLEGRFPLVGVVEGLVGEPLAEPRSLDPRHVPDQPEQGQLRRRHRPLRQLCAG
jgi:hypothetical protein